MGKGYIIEGEREYFPCGCSFVVDRKTGETLQSFPCAKHRYIEAGQEKSRSEGPRKRSRP